MIVTETQYRKWLACGNILIFLKLTNGYFFNTIKLNSKFFNNILKLPKSTQKVYQEISSNTYSETKKHQTRCKNKRTTLFILSAYILKGRKKNQNVYLIYTVFKVSHTKNRRKQTKISTDAANLHFESGKKKSKVCILTF